MKTTTLFLASAIALCLVLPYCSARPGEVYVKKQASQEASASASTEQASSEQIVKKGGCGCGGASYAASKKKSSKAASASSSRSSSSYEAVASGGCGCKELTDVQIKEIYAQKSGEKFEDYCKRIVSKSYPWTSTNEAYVKTLTRVWENFYTIPLWYDVKYIPLIKDFYTCYYQKADSEPWKSYYARLVTRKKWETDEWFAKRIHVLRDCFPSCDLWTSDKWFNKYTKSLYALEFKKFESESEPDYMKRVFGRDQFFDTDDIKWAKKLALIQQAIPTSCSLWYSDKYSCYTKKFVETYYQKTKEVTGDAWLLNVLTPLPGESYDSCLTRVRFINQCTKNWGFWKVDYFNKIKQAKSLQEAWLTQVQKAFFPCGCGGAVTVEKSSSKKASSSSSASASSERAQYTKVVA